MTAAFWSRFKLLLLSRAYVLPGVSGEAEAVCSALGGTGLRLEVTDARGRIDLDAGPLGGGHDDRAQVLALRGRRLRADQLLDDRPVVLQQGGIVEGRLAHGHV